MTREPVVAIVGRPNVGKSTLFNRIAGRRIAIVEETPGITRDRIYASCEWYGKRFSLVDTGGLQFSKEALAAQVREQARFAIAEADVILFIVDAKEGLTGLDHEIAELLRKTGKPVLLVANKVESKRRLETAEDFLALRMGPALGVSAAHGIEVGELLDHLAEFLPETPEEPEEPDVIKVAIVGRPNVGKSSLLNAILGEERAIVSEAPGTTRDSLDTPYQWGDRRFVLIDTAGIRRKAKVEIAYEYYSVLRAFQAIERCDVSCLMLDPLQGVTDQDKRIGGHAHEEGRAQVVVVNKWDLMQERVAREREVERLSEGQDRTLMKDFAREVQAPLPFMTYAPIVFVSALKGMGIPALMDTVVSAAEQHALHIPTPALNRVLAEGLSRRPINVKGKPLRLYYATQPRVRPPTVALFVNDPELVHFSHARFFENVIRKAYSLEGTPLRISFRKSKGKGEREE